MGDPQEDSAERAAARLRAAKLAIISRWEQRVRADERYPQSEGQSALELRDHLPQLIDQLVEDMEDGACEPAAAARGARPASRAHALQRLRQGYDVSAVLRELVHLRATILETIEGGESRPPIDPACRSTIERTIDEVMMDAAAEHQRLSSEELRREAAFRERFIAIRGHDLRQPLSTVVMGAELLSSVPDAASLAERIGRSARRMEAMVRELLDFSVARQEGTLSLTRNTVDLRAVLGDVISELKLAHPGAQLELDAPESEQGVWDGVRLIQVVSNLAGNALEHGAEGKPVRISLRGDEDAVVLTICNANRAGPLSPERIERLFDAFESGSESGGLGLGLFIASQIVKAHRGHIDCHSDETGTRFRVRLPRR